MPCRTFAGIHLCIAYNSTPNAAAKAVLEFLVWAIQDSYAAPLQRLQMVKTWMEDGEAREQVTDIVCSFGATIWGTRDFPT